MSLALIKDYLQTQGLRLAVDSVRMAHLASQAVVTVGQAEIDRALLRPADLQDAWAEYWPQNDENDAVLKQIFMALDAVFSRLPAQSAAVYAMPSEKTVLLRVAQQGLPVEAVLAVDDAAAERSWAVRSAQTGWLNLVDDVRAWGEDAVGHDRCLSVMSLPVCLENGRVLGVLHIEAAEPSAFDEERQAEWVGLALALVESLKVLSGAGEESGDE